MAKKALGREEMVSQSVARFTAIAQFDPGYMGEQVCLFFALLHVFGEVGWPYVPPVERPESHAARGVELLARGKIMDAARERISVLSDLTLVLPPCP